MLFEERNNQHIYVDTSHLQAYLWGDRDEVVYKDAFKKAIHMSEQNPEIFIKIPFVVVGEMINNLKRKDKREVKEDAISNFLDLLGHYERVDIIPANFNSFRMAVKIKNESNRLDDTDILITSQALCDPYSSHLLTNDSELIESIMIDKINTKMKNNGDRFRKLKIGEDL